jgi:transcriptional regulator with XRE-family HTH domain
MTTMAENLRLIRKKRGYTQPEIGKKIGKGIRSIVHYEKGERVPPSDVLKKWADVCEVRVEDLYSEKNIIDVLEDQIEDTLEEKIDDLTKQNEALENEHKRRVQQQILESIVKTDAIFTLKIKFQGLRGVKLQLMNHSDFAVDVYSEKLGYTQEYIQSLIDDDMKNEYSMGKNKMATILEESSLNKAVSIGETTYNLMKTLIGSSNPEVVVPVDLTYKTNNKGFIKATCNCLINIKTMTIVANIKFLDQEGAIKDE